MASLNSVHGECNALNPASLNGNTPPSRQPFAPSPSEGTAPSVPKAPPDTRKLRHLTNQTTTQSYFHSSWGLAPGFLTEFSIIANLPPSLNGPAFSIFRLHILPIAQNLSALRPVEIPSFASTGALESTVMHFRKLQHTTIFPGQNRNDECMNFPIAATPLCSNVQPRQIQAGRAIGFGMRQAAPCLRQSGSRTLYGSRRNVGRQASNRQNAAPLNRKEQSRQTSRGIGDRSPVPFRCEAHGSNG